MGDWHRTCAHIPDDGRVVNGCCHNPGAVRGPSYVGYIPPVSAEKEKGREHISLAIRKGVRQNTMWRLSGRQLT